MSTLPPPKKKERYLYIFAFLLSLLVIILLVITFAHEILNTYKAKNWVEVSCVIKKINVIKGRNTKINIEYLYFLDNKQYRGTRFDFGDNSKSSLAVPNSVNDIKIGSTYHCYVNPNNPEESVFNKKIDKFKIVEFCGQIGIIIVFLSMFRILINNNPSHSFRENSY